jgi:uncharacterized DUF497 family protein
MLLEFEWDEQKAILNKRKHDVTFIEASTVFSDSLSLTIPDPLSSTTEQRYILIGRSSNQKLLVVVHTDRGDAIRIISARMATIHELRMYEET